MRKVERVEMDGLYVVTAADSSPTSREAIREQVRAAARKARARFELRSPRSPVSTPAGEHPLPSLPEQG